jgi:hypothetical protein
MKSLQKFASVHTKSTTTSTSNAILSIVTYKTRRSAALINPISPLRKLRVACECVAATS